MTATPIRTPEQVSAAFDVAAQRYDLMVALNPGYHHHLRRAADALTAQVAGRRVPGGARPARVLDLGCGSGASTSALVRRLPPDVEVVGVDASLGMLAQAQAKRWRPGVRFVAGRAEDLARDRAEWGLAEPADGVLAAYLFRNVTARDEALRAVYDLLAPGGCLVVQEYSVSGRRLAAVVWSLVCWLAVVPLAWVTSRDTRLYRYLWRSVVSFDSRDAFADRMRRAGFVGVRVDTVRGWQRGILHTFTARRPEAA